MRELVGALVFLTLLLVGFLATPGVFKLVNPDYLLTLRDYRAPLAKLSGDLLEINKKIDQADASISSLERSTAQLVADSNAKAATLSIANAPAEALASAAAEYGRKSAGLKIDLDQAKAEKSGLEQQRKTLEDARAEMTKKLDASEAESTNLYLVTRALALGAIGALMSIFAKFLSITRTPSYLVTRASWQECAHPWRWEELSPSSCSGSFLPGSYPYSRTRNPSREIRISGKSASCACSRGPSPIVCFKPPLVEWISTSVAPRET
jgi:hypothetical protein